MSSTTTVILAWAAGLIAGAVLSLPDLKDPRQYAMLAVSATLALVVGFLPFRGEHVLSRLLLHQPEDYAVGWHAALSCVVFVGGFAFALKRVLMPSISEAVLLGLNAVFLFVFVPHVGVGTPLFYFMVVPSACALLLVVLPGDLPASSKIVLYAWALVMLVLLGGEQADLGLIRQLASAEASDAISFRDAFVAGVAFFGLGVYATYLVLLLPIPSRRQTWDDALREWQEYTTLMARRFDDHRERLRWMVVLLAVAAGALYVEQRWQPVPRGLFVSSALVVVPWLSRGRRGVTTDRVGAADAVAQ